MSQQKQHAPDALFAMDGYAAERILAKALETRDSLEAIMRTPLKSISAAAGEMERESPLFYGSGTNPTLF